MLRAREDVGNPLGDAVHPEKRNRSGTPPALKRVPSIVSPSEKTARRAGSATHVPRNEMPSTTLRDDARDDKPDDTGVASYLLSAARDSAIAYRRFIVEI